MERLVFWSLFRLAELFCRYTLPLRSGQRLNRNRKRPLDPYRKLRLLNGKHRQPGQAFRRKWAKFRQVLPNSAQIPLGWINTGFGYPFPISPMAASDNPVLCKIIGLNKLIISRYYYRQEQRNLEFRTLPLFQPLFIAAWLEPNIGKDAPVLHYAAGAWEIIASSVESVGNHINVTYWYITHYGWFRGCSF